MPRRKPIQQAAVFERLHELPQIKYITRPVGPVDIPCAPRKYGGPSLSFRKEELVLLKVEAASICGTDLHIIEGTHGSAPPVVLGHEYIGQVIEIGSEVTNVKPKDRVAVDPNIKCGFCSFCRRGKPNLCPNLTTLGIFIDGGFAEYNLVPAKQLYLLPENLPTERAIFFEPLSCVLSGLEKIKIQPGETILIFGAGPIGCLFAAMAKVAGASFIYVTEPSDYRRNFLKTLGAIALDPDIFANQSGLEFAEVVIDAAGYHRALADAIAAARIGGRILLFGQQDTTAKVTINPTLANQKELQIFGSYAAATSFEKSILMLAHPGLPLEKLVTHKLPLSEISKAFELLRKQQALEIIIYPQEVG